ncbi:hypothetical protein R5R35_004475 [Gryllus longicercus]
MAAVKSKVEASITKKDDNTSCDKKSKQLGLQMFELCLSAISLCTFIADFSTDVIVVISYFHYGKMYWAIITLLFIIVPAIIVQLFSMRWYITDDKAHWYHWLTHAFLLGVLHRYVEVLKTGVESWSGADFNDVQRLYHQWNDVCLLHLFESFMESAPQLLIQIYIMINLEDWWSWTGASAAASAGSLAWALAAHALARRRAEARAQAQAGAGPSPPAEEGGAGAAAAAALAALALRALWRAGLLAARVAALLLCAVACGAWLFLLLGIHWIAMTTWILLQKTDFCTSVWEERIYNCVVGVIYCFCFFNLKNGPSRKKALIFYCITIAQNLGCLGLFITLAGYTRPVLAQAGAGTILGGTVLGLASMLLYYRYFHPIVPVALCRQQVGVSSVGETCTTVLPGEDPGYRSLKGRGTLDHGDAPQRLNNATHEDSTNVDDSCTDKKLLLNHWVSCPTTTPSESVKTDIEIPSVKEDFNVNSENSSTLPNSDDIRKQKRRGICSSEALELELEDSKEISIISHKDIMLDCDERHKRRGICSLESELELDLEMVLPGMDSDITLPCAKDVDCSDEIRKQKRRGILSSADLCLELEEDAKNIINTENKHVVVNLDAVDGKESTFSDSEFKCDLMKGPTTQGLKTTDLRLVANEEAVSEVLSAPSEVLSAHDYENICAVNIAREAWGLRSWRGYSDIETWLHDDSVVRDRRRDTLTSTVTTITSASSEQSAASGERGSTPPPLPSRRPRTTRSRQDDYLDTLADDLAACDRPLAEFTAEPEIDPNLYMARPYLIDQHGTLFPLTTLDTIMEEIEETSTDTSDSVRYWHKHGSASTLVATIDEIRGNSICNLYNSSEVLWGACGNPSLNVLNEQNGSLCENNMGHHASYENAYSGGSFSHLSPEEVLFLSKLKPSDSVLVGSPGNKLDHSSDSTSFEMSVGFSCNNDVTENMFADTMPLAFKNNFGIKKSDSKAHRKFLSLQEKFETKQSDNSKTKKGKVNFGFESSPETMDNESNSQTFAGSTEALVPVSNSNETPAVIHRIHQWNNFLKSQNNRSDSSRSSSLAQNCDVNQIGSKPNMSSLKERRTMFLKQVLSPPRFQNWSKKSTSSIGPVQLRAS